VKLVELVEAAYQHADRPEPWLNRLIDAVAHLDSGLGICAYTWAETPAGIQRTSDIVVRNAPDGVAELADAFVAAPTFAEQDIAYRRTPACMTMSQAFGSRPPDTIDEGFWLFFDRALKVGIGDLIGIKTVDPTGVGAALAVLLPRPEPGAVNEREEALWHRAMVHVSAGLRLGGALRVENADAVLEPDGRCVHAEGRARARTAREALRDAALRVDHARTNLRDDPRAALDAWRGLVDGRWSLVDHFDHDGRHYLLAHQNDPKLADPRALSVRERQTAAYAAMGWSNKEIAYALGVAPSTVSSHLAAARRKLGVTDDAHLGQLAAALRAVLPEE
jgi:DNA-binding CsgD family transcriptional regulator